MLLQMFLQMRLFFKELLIHSPMVKDLLLFLKLVWLKSNMVIWFLCFSSHPWFLKHLPPTLPIQIILLPPFHPSPQVWTLSSLVPYMFNLIIGSLIHEPMNTFVPLWIYYILFIKLNQCMLLYLMVLLWLSIMLALLFLSPHFHITNVLYSPHFKVNLILVSKLNILSCHVDFLPDMCLIQDLKSQKMIGLGSVCDGLYRLDTSSCHKELSISSSTSLCANVSLNSCNSVCSHVAISCIPSNAIWHFRLGHLSNQRLSKMHHLYPSISVDNKATCDICHFAKQRKLPYHSSQFIANSKFDLLHFDIWGPLAQTSVHGHKYFLTIVDDFRRFLWVILLKTKAEVSMHVKIFIQLIETHHHLTPKFIRPDNIPTRTSTRNKVTPAYLQDYVCTAPANKIVLVNTPFPIFFHIQIYLTLIPFLLCLLFLTLSQNPMLRLSNMTVGNKQCRLNLMLLIRLGRGR